MPFADCLKFMHGSLKRACLWLTCPRFVQGGLKRPCRLLTTPLIKNFNFLGRGNRTTWISLAGAKPRPARFIPNHVLSTFHSESRANHVAVIRATAAVLPGRRICLKVTRHDFESDTPMFECKKCVFFKRHILKNHILNVY